MLQFEILIFHDSFLYARVPTLEVKIHQHMSHSITMLQFEILIFHDSFLYARVPTLEVKRHQHMSHSIVGENVPVLIHSLFSSLTEVLGGVTWQRMSHSFDKETVILLPINWALLLFFKSHLVTFYIKM